MTEKKQSAKVFEFSGGEKVAPEKNSKSIQEQVQELAQSQIQEVEDDNDEYSKVIHPESGITKSDACAALGTGELGLGKLFVKLNRNRFCYNTDKKSWYKFNGYLWVLDERKEVFDGVRYLYEVLQYALREHMDGLKNATREAYVKNLFSLRNINKMEQILKQARTGRDGLGVPDQWFDNHLQYIGADNGVIDLHSGKLLAGDPEMYITKKVGCDFNEDAPEPVQFKTFLESIFKYPLERNKSELSDEDFNLSCKAESENLISFLQRLFGYMLLGSCREHIFLVLYGPKGRNGKGELSRIMIKVFGDYGGDIAADQLTLSSFNRDSSGSSEDIMYLKDKRLVIASETKQGALFDTSFIKRSTGGDSLVGRHNHGKQMTFAPTHTTCLQTNFIPNAPSEEDAFFSRLLIIPFFRHFCLTPDPGDIYQSPIDLKIDEKLAGEMPGLLKWVVDGALMYQKEGLKKPAGVLKIVDDYKKDRDIFQEFIDEFCDVDSKRKERTTPFHKAFNQFLKDNGHSKPFQAKTIGNRLEHKGFVRRKITGNWHYLGIILNINGVDLIGDERHLNLSADHYIITESTALDGDHDDFSIDD